MTDHREDKKKIADHKHPVKICYFGESLGYKHANVRKKWTLGSEKRLKLQNSLQRTILPTFTRIKHNFLKAVYFMIQILGELMKHNL